MKIKSFKKYFMLILSLSAVLFSAGITFIPNFPLNWNKIYNLIDEESVCDINSYGSGDCVAFLDVGQADCSLIMSNGEAALIDCGGCISQYDVVNNLKKFGIKRIKYIFISHYHTDHIGGVPYVMESFDVENVIASNFFSDTDTDKSIINYVFDAIELENCVVSDYSTNDVYYVGNFMINCIHPYAFCEDENSNSAVIKASCNKVDFLFMGDSGIETEDYLSQYTENISCDVLKVGHHGSNTSTSQKFIGLTTPDISIVSCGVNNVYSLPDSDVVSRLNKAHSKLYRTDLSGDIIISITASNSFKVKTER